VVSIEDSDGDHVNNDRNETFLLSYNNVALYGRFAGTESVRNQRDWETNVTGLSGDIDGNDTTDAHGVVITTTHISGDNACHVLRLDGESNEPITGDTVIDGFIITAGQAEGCNSSLDRAGGGMVCAGHGSGNECSPSLTNVTFSGNFADWGGAMYNHGSGSGVSNPTLANVTFSGNSADDCGGAMYNSGFGGTSSPVLTNVILWGNTAFEGDQMYSYYATPAIGYSDVEGGWDGSGVYNYGTSAVTDLGGNIDADPLFVDAGNGDLHLQRTSPAIDAGNYYSVIVGVTTDRDGNPRFVDIPGVTDTGIGLPPIVDMGAYEVQLHVFLPLVGGFYRAPSQTTGAVALADAPLENHPAQTGLSTGSNVPAEGADWWATVQEDIRQSEYHVTWQEQTYLADVAAAYQAPNRAQNLRTYFTAQGLVVIPRAWPEGGETPPWRWELKLAAWGRASALEDVPAVELRAQDNRIEYRRGAPPTGPSASSGQASGQSLVEWYLNDENGLEQGFTLAAPPQGGQAGEPLQLDLLLGGDLVAAADIVAGVVRDGTAIEFQNPDGEDGLHYGSLQWAKRHSSRV
jgi:hypothetical protein